VLIGPASRSPAARGAARDAAGSALTDRTGSPPSRKRSKSRRSRDDEGEVNDDEYYGAIEESDSEPGRDTSAAAAQALALAQNRARRQQDSREGLRLAMAAARDGVSSPRPPAPSPTPEHARAAAAATFSSTQGADPLVPTFTLPGQNGDARQQGGAAAYAPRASSESTRRLGERDVQRTVQSHFGVAQNQQLGGSEFQQEAAAEPSAGSRRRAGSSRRGRGSANPDDGMECD